MSTWLDGGPTSFPWESAPEDTPEPEAGDKPAGSVRRGLVPALAALLGAVVGAAGMLAFADRGVAPASSVRVAAPISRSASNELTGVAAVAAKVMPSVVRIDVVSARGRFGRATGTGSGVIYRADGYILTNDHVVDGATDVRVTLASGEELPARVVGSAMPSDDIAVVKVERTNLPAATLGSTSDLRVGDPAIAIGSPFGLQGTVTAGVVSALHRNVNLGDDQFTDAIQTDAPINPGNSGGALADANGAVVGINTAILGSGDGNVGVGFAIPIDIARNEAEQIIRTGRASRPLIGISGESVPNGGGALVQQVTPGGPAARAGLQAGDTVVAVDDEKIGSMDELVSVLSRLEVGREVTVTFTRDGARQTAKVMLGSRSDG